MATANQRAISILDALVNGTATTEQRNRALAAFGSADAFIRAVRSYVLGVVTNSESAASVATARQQAETSVQTGFTEAP